MLDILRQQFALTPGWVLVAIIGTGLTAYFLGCCNGAVMISRFVLKDDVRQHGSGNGGLTNFCRVHGGALSVFVILIDVLKTVVSLLLAAYVFRCINPELVPLAKYWAGLCCSLGHGFPCTFRFKGGKGVLSGGVIAIMIDWRLALLVWGAFVILAVTTRYVSLGSIAAGALFPVGTVFLYRDPLIIVLSILVGGMLVVKHHANIRRLISGTESKFKMKGTKKTGESAGQTEEKQ